jgi:hypothetical protein
MDDFSLYARMREYGTLAEKPDDIPDARFAFPSTIHWMRALAILIDDLKLDFKSAKTFYVKVQRRQLSEKEVNSICEQLLFALHQLASLYAISDVKNKADVARIGIVAWYYGVYGAASAMIAAADGSFPDNHAATAQQWDRHFAANGLAIPPFADRLSNLVAQDIDRELAPVRARGRHSLTSKPTTPQQAWGCCAEYLSGTAEWDSKSRIAHFLQRQKTSCSRSVQKSETENTCSPVLAGISVFERPSAPNLSRSLVRALRDDAAPDRPRPACAAA